MNAIDTNVLIYARDPRDARKQQTAADLIQALPDAVLLWQVACEYIAASRKLSAPGSNDDRARKEITLLSRVWLLQVPTHEVLRRAREISRTVSLSIWDSLLIAACVEARVSTLYTEDLSHGLTIGGVRIVNPFV